MIRRLLIFNKRVAKLLQILGFLQTLQFIVQWSLGRELIEFTIRDVPNKLYARRKSSDIHTLWQTFGRREIMVPINFYPRLIIDGGGNVGYTAVYFATKYPQATIISVEPDLDNYHVLQLNASDLPNIRVIHGAIWPSNAPLMIANPSVPNWSYRVTENSSLISGQVQAPPSFTPSEIISFSNQRPILFKLDVEGAEKQIFSITLGEHR